MIGILDLSFANLDTDADLELVLAVENSIRYYDKVGGNYVNQTGVQIILSMVG